MLVYLSVPNRAGLILPRPKRQGKMPRCVPSLLTGNFSREVL